MFTENCEIAHVIKNVYDEELNIKLHLKLQFAVHQVLQCNQTSS